MNEKPDTEQIKAQLAREIVRFMDDHNLTDAAAGERSGVTAGQVAQLRAGTIQQFSIDCLIDILNAFDRHVEVKVRANSNPLATLVEKIAAITASVPAEEWDKLPRDLAANHDHYLYGTPKRD